MSNFILDIFETEQQEEIELQKDSFLCIESKNAVQTSKTTDYEVARFGIKYNNKIIL